MKLMLDLHYFPYFAKLVIKTVKFIQVALILKYVFQMILFGFVPTVTVRTCTIQQASAQTVKQNSMKNPMIPVKTSGSAIIWHVQPQTDAPRSGYTVRS